MTPPQGVESLIPEKGIALFTDGSCWSTDRSGGWAWVAIDCFDNEASASGYESDTTNNRMEMQAWIKGLNSIADVHGACEILVYSDSQYVGFGVMDSARLRNANADLWWDLDRASERHDYIEFIHVKGHPKPGDVKRGHALNAKVDKMAGDARTKGRDAGKGNN